MQREAYILAEINLQGLETQVSRKTKELPKFKVGVLVLMKTFTFVWISISW